MTRHGQDHGRRPTTPSRAPGESGDPEARREADRAVLRDAGGGDDDGAGAHTAKRQRPGTGREEQVRPHHPQGGRPEPESGDG
ncbi:MULTISPECIES: hypothetical protein [Streptomyces]|uniref:Uncharacterized protein n=1 Tax=Streptomyces yangpuensis TaxID=1648182 RepID=A0ABY5Q5V8_9ACTN|nr:MULTISPECIES: hypothetical protein [Streptomyces]MBZ9599811.1 hypothetical protein [Streptomyces erythrochromogenes]UUY51373.1 hypothetical protein NRK68_31565 [Streptomyces yangpuensis]